jgi:pimeloyl-ACP methyl ester carboxylesterase
MRMSFHSRSWTALRRAGGAVAAALLGLALPGAAAAAPDPTAAHVDYADPALWLCRPDLADNRCKVDLDATVVAPSGRLTLERHVPARDPKIDCFFVYPTVSMDPTWQSDFQPDHMEWDDIRLQFARFSRVCRQFAPLYRQGTLTALRAPGGGPKPVGERPAPGVGGFSDVLDAWRWYMAHENRGRGVVLIGHSQGGAMIARLIAQEIDGKPAQAQLVSALILGAPVMVPPGHDVGGTFKAVPLCRSGEQVGCVISYASFRDRVPPPANSRFGRARDGLRAACVNPADLADGDGRPKSYFLTRGFLNGSGTYAQPDWVRPPKPIATPFVTTPGLISTRCVTRGEFDYLEVHVNADSRDPRTDEVAGEIIRSTGLDASWGLHLIDVDHSMGDLLRIVERQGARFTAAARSY